jgi:uncharacterized membrane protein
LFQTSNVKSLQIFAIIVIIQFFLFLSVILNLAVLRQVLGFLYLTFVPGFAIVRLLRIKQLSKLETAILSVGFSIAITMLIGLMLNELHVVSGFIEPFDTLTVLITISCLVLLSAVISLIRDKSLFDSNSLPLDFSKKMLVFAAIPVLSVVGVFLANTTHDNSVLLIMFIFTAVVIILGVSSKKLIPSKYFMIILLMVTIALLFHRSLTSNYILGNDIHTEYNVFTLTQTSGFWSNVGSGGSAFGRYGDMLSVTILPTIYSNVMNLDATWVLKIVFPLLFSFVPLILFQFWQDNWSKKTAFVASILMVSQITFYEEMLTLARQMIAEVFFVLLIYVFFNKKLNSMTGKICFVVFGIGLVVSHYALALIFLFIIIGVWILAKWFKSYNNKIGLFHILFFAIVMFSWYIFTRSSVTFQSIQEFSGFLINQLGNFFSPTARPTLVLTAVGLTTPQSLWQLLSRLTAYSIEILVVLGFISLLVKRKKQKTSLELLFVMLFGIVLLGMSIVLPGFAGTLQITRFFHISLLLIAPFFVIGYKTCIGFFKQKRAMPKIKMVSLILVAILLTTYLLFQTNFVYEVTGEESWSIPLSGYRMDKMKLYSWGGYVDELSAAGAQWSFNNVNPNATQVFADEAFAFSALRSYGHLDEAIFLTNETSIGANTVTILSKLNVIYGEFGSSTQYWNSSLLSSQFISMDSVYSNGGSEVWFKP